MTEGGCTDHVAPGQAIVERLDAARLDELEPLWEALLAHHADVGSVLPARSLAESWPRRRRQYEEWLRAPGSFVLAARRGDRLIGYAMVSVWEGGFSSFRSGERMAELETLVVLPQARDAGVGSRLFDEVVAELGRLGVDDILVGTIVGNEGARRFYERRGFKPFVEQLYARRADALPTKERET